MDFQELMLAYGYPMLFLGVLLESEAFLLIGVYLAHRGYFSLPAVIGLAALSSFFITQVCFLLGNRFGPAFIGTRPRWQLRYQRIERLMNRYGTGLVIGFRVIYGLRGAIPAAMGLAGFSSTRFMLWNAFGALIWAFAVTFLGGNLVQGLQQLYEYVHPSGMTLFLVLAGIGGLWFVYLMLKRKRLKNQVSSKPDVLNPSVPFIEGLSETGPLPYHTAVNQFSGDFIAVPTGTSDNIIKHKTD